MGPQSGLFVELDRARRTLIRRLIRYPDLIDLTKKARFGGLFSSSTRSPQPRILRKRSNICSFAMASASSAWARA